MSTDTTVSNLIINKLTKAQYAAATKSPTELYYVTDEDAYQEKLTAGTNITIENNVISSTAPTYTASTGINITSNAIKATGVEDANDGTEVKTWTGTKAEYDAIVNKDIGTLYHVTDVDVYQRTLVSGTNIKTVNGNSLLGSGNLTIDALPLTGGNMHPAAGETDVRIEAVDNNGDSIGELNFNQSLSGSNTVELISKGDIDVRADEDGSISLDASGGTGSIYLTTDDGSINLETRSGEVLVNSNKVLTEGDIDSSTITLNSSDEIQTVGVIDQNDTTKAIKTWTGTRQQYDAILSKDSDTLYTITDDAATGGVVFDNALSSTSENAVQNKTLYAIIGDIETLINAL